MNQSAPRSHPASPQLDSYPHQTAENVRFRDLDPQGHVNQAVFNTYFESGRVAMFRNPDLGIGVPGATFVVARMEVNYLRELRWPAAIHIGTSVAEFGRTSFIVAQAIFDAGACAATGRATMVCIDLSTRKSRALPEEAIERLSRWKYRGP